MGDFFRMAIFTIFVWIISGMLMYHVQNDYWINKINTWAIEQKHAKYDSKTGELIYYDESIKKLIDKE